MQTANIMVHLGGDSGTIVQKYNVTPSEIAILIAIHGPSSVNDVEPLDAVAQSIVGGKRSDREELERLAEIYGRTKINGPDGEIGVMRALFPGAGSRAIQTLEELNLDETFYKAETRAKPKAAPVEKKTRAAKAEAPADDEALFG